MFMGASSARVSPPFQRHVLWVARSISGFTSPKERASWKMSSPPIATARLRKAAQSSRPAVVTRSRVLDMALLLVRFAQLEQAIVEAHVAAQQPQPATEKQREQSADAHHATDQSSAHQCRDQHIAVARAAQQVQAGAACDVKHIGNCKSTAEKACKHRQQDEDIEGLQADQSQSGTHKVARTAPFFPAAQLGLGAEFAAQPQRIAQRGGDLIFIAPGCDGVAEMGFIVRHDVVDLVRRKSFQALPKSREKKRAAHGSSPSIFSTEAMKLFHSPR